MTNIPVQSLVVFKNSPARVTASGDKLELLLLNGQNVKVRPKDVVFLHRGPFEFSKLQEDFSQLEEAWELAQGENLNLGDLSELLLGEASAQAAWNVWLVLQQDLHFEGQVDNFKPRSPEAVAQRLEQREGKQKELEAKQAFLERCAQRCVLPEDAPLLKEVEDVALELSEQSNLLKQLKINQQSYSARLFLVEVGHWTELTNPNACMAVRERSLEPITEYTPSESSPVDSEIPDAEALEQRLDLTHLTAWAIDDQDSKDPDDAIGLEGDALWVHIADVADIVVIDNPIDVEARERGANLYLPEWTSPMLPESITLERGLGLRTLSKALSFKIVRQPDGNAHLVQWGPSWVRVTRTSYGQADLDVENQPELKRCFEFLKSYDEWRRTNGALELNLPEVKVIAKNPKAVEVRPLDDGLSRMAVKNAMLMCGQAVARFALENNIPVPYSQQGPPKEVEPPVELDPQIPHQAFALRRRMQPSEQSCVPGFHSGLGLEPYVQCTSPLRRYGDLLVHQQLRAFHGGGQLRSPAELEQALALSREASRQLRRLERRSNLHWTLVYLNQCENWEGPALVLEVEDRGVKILIESLALEQKIFPDFALSVGQHCWLKCKKVDLLGEKALFHVSAIK
jgi:exoribonuclease II